MQYGYIRVSTKEQNEDRQLQSMQSVGIATKNLFIDKQSGKDFERPNYKKLIKKLKEGDVVYVKSIDRLGRNYNEILEQWRIITKKIKASIVVIDMPLLDTRKKQQDLTGMFIADLVLQILSYVAQTERENIKQRQAEGIALAKAKGKHMGRPPCKKPENLVQVHALYQSGLITQEKASELLGVSRATYIRWAKALSIGKDVELDNINCKMLDTMI